MRLAAPRSGSTPAPKRAWHTKRRTWAGAAFAAGLVLGVGGSPAGNQQASSPAPTATITMTAEPAAMTSAEAAATVTATATATARVTATQTITAPPATVTAPAPTVTRTVTRPAQAGDSGSNSNASDSSSTRVGLSSGGGTDPRFSSCKKAKAAGYGPYVQGQDAEYNWYRDADSDGTVCE